MAFRSSTSNSSLLAGDASYYVALLYPRDRQHEPAVELGREIARARVRTVTHEPILFEVLAFFSRMRPEIRTKAADYVAGLQADPLTLVLPVTGGLLQRSINFYRSRSDQPYSLTDCATMEICRELGITEILTADTDFEREGFAILLKP